MGLSGPKPRRLSAGRIGIYAFLIVAALFFLIPLYVMIVTSLKGDAGDPARQHLFDLPREPTFEPWVEAW